MTCLVLSSDMAHMQLTIDKIPYLWIDYSPSWLPFAK